MKKINFKKMLVAISVLGLIAGCAQVGPKTKKGALIGAGTGAVVGAVSGGSVLQSAAIGTAVGAGVGYYQDTK
ncbi:MAG: hypothetical protein LT067_07090 [Sulfurovum sp.]|nr:hypothetical protein [Sulfurovum sp.]